MRTVCERPGPLQAGRETGPEREKNTGELSWKAAPVIAVAGSGRTAAWLAAIAKENGLSWQVEREKGGGPSRLLVLPVPSDRSELYGARRAVVSLDSPAGRRLAARPELELFTFSEGRDAADLTAKALCLEKGGLSFVAVTRSAIARVRVEREALYPALAALSCAVWLGVPLERAAHAVTARQ